MHKIILTMTTVPARTVDILPASLSVLTKLNYDNYEIHLNVPDVCKSTGEKYTIPNSLRSIEKLKIFEGIEDLGPKTKIIPTLQRIDDSESIIITVDDDIIYHKDLIAYHLKCRERYPNAALGFSGTKQRRLILTPKSDIEVDILDNYKSASYTKGMFNDEFFSHYADQSWNDDIVVSAYLRDQGVKKIVLAYDQETFFVPRVKSFPLVNLLDCPMTGCDIIRGHANKSNSYELQDMYESVKYGK